MAGILLNFSNALVKTSSPKSATDRRRSAADRLKEAIKQFENNLSSDERYHFCKLRSQSVSTAHTTQDVIQLTKDYDALTSERHGGHCYGQRFHSFLSGIQRFAAIGDVLVGGSQNLVACGIWSLVRMSLMVSHRFPLSQPVAEVLQSVVNLSDHIEMLSELFMRIGRSIPNFEEIVLLYPLRTEIKTDVIEYCIKVVELCSHIYGFARKSTIRQIASSLDSRKVENLKNDLELRGKFIKDKAKISEAQANAISRDLNKDFQRRETNRRVLKFCSTYDHETPWKQIRRLGKTSFFQQQTEYLAWRDKSHASTLLYKGKLGAGKSVLLANIVDDLSLSTLEPKPLVVYFFCRHENPESLKSRTVIGSLARQLLYTVEDLGSAAQRCDITYTTDDPEKVLGILLEGFSPGARVYFVLDGLDECDPKEREIIVQVLRQIQEKLKILVCVSFREEPSDNGLRLTSQQLLGTCVLSIPVDNPDIKAFIEADLKICLEQKRLIVGDEQLKDQIQKALLEGSKGMFLWTALQIQSLCSMKTDHAIREALADLPRDLSDTYARILQKSGSSDSTLQVETLQIVLAAKTPLSKDELREALSVTPGDTAWDHSKLLNDVNSALASCGCVLVVDEEDLTVRVVHHSFVQYVRNGLVGLRHTELSFEQAEARLADIVVTHYRFDTALSRTTQVARPDAQSALSTIEKSMPKAAQTAQQTMRLFRPAQSCKVAIGGPTTEKRNASLSQAQSEYKFQDYAERYWQEHILHVSGDDDKIFKLSSRLIRARAFKLIEVDKARWKQYQRNAEIGTRDIISTLLEAGKIDINVRYKDGWTPLIFAASNGHDKIIEILLRTGNVDTNVKDNNGRTALSEAARNGHAHIVEMLLPYSSDVIEAKDHFGYAPLMQAVRSGDKETVGKLLSVADYETKDQNGWTPLIAAVSTGDIEIVELLLSPTDVQERKADIEAKTNSGVTSLMQAIRGGHTEVVKLLVNSKADVGATDSYGWTALMYAERNNDGEMIQVLRSRSSGESTIET